VENQTSSHVTENITDFAKNRLHPNTLVESEHLALSRRFVIREAGASERLFQSRQLLPDKR